MRRINPGALLRDTHGIRAQLPLLELRDQQPREQHLCEFRARVQVRGAEVGVEVLLGGEGNRGGREAVHFAGLEDEARVGRCEEVREQSEC